MRLLIAGSSGFLGSQLRASLETEGHFVVRLVRGTPTAADQIRWRPYDEPLDPDVLDDVDVVVNLAGSALVGNPHSSRWANELMRSRVETTRTLAEAIAKAPRQPVFLAGNATGYYGDHGDEVLTEKSKRHGDTFLSSVTAAWQDAAQPAVDAGGRVVVMRSAPVLDRRNPPLSLLAPLFKLGLGGPLGTGEQYFPVTTTDDWVRAVIFCAQNDDVSGTGQHHAARADHERRLHEGPRRPGAPADLLHRARDGAPPGGRADGAGAAGLGAAAAAGAPRRRVRVPPPRHPQRPRVGAPRGPLGHRELCADRVQLELDVHRRVVRELGQTRLVEVAAAA
jgi:uncharacterized protein (TIGR01777 family)